MDPVTHVASGLLLSQLIPSPSRGWAALAGVIISILPDLDYLLKMKYRLAYVRYHRAFTHSLLAVPLWALLVAIVARLLGGPRWFLPMFFLGLAVVSAHLLLDLTTSYGTQLLSPFSRRKFTLDLIFIIDPYLTIILVTGALTALCFPDWGRGVSAVCLAGAVSYLFICGYYHHQALSLGRQVFQKEARAGATIAALPQPFSCRRWQVIAAQPREIKQTLVELPYQSWPRLKWSVKELQVAAAAGLCPRVPGGDYQPPESMIIQDWRAAAAPRLTYGPEAQRLLAIYLDFARFPLLVLAESQSDDFSLQWVDLRFTVPGRLFPFTLRMRLDADGHLLQGVIGRYQVRKDEIGG